jgi:hypothetical protein
MGTHLRLLTGTTIISLMRFWLEHSCILISPIFSYAQCHYSSFGKSRILVIGIIGPQNSGKSTLLNFMFGCVFTASDGRTTKVLIHTRLKEIFLES